MRVCAIGNSHISPLAHAVSNGHAPQDREFTFFAAAASIFDDLLLADHHLVTNHAKVKESFKKSSGGLESINIADFDEFIIVGLGLWIGNAISIYERYTCDSMCSDAGARYMLSDACFRAAIEAGILKSRTFRLAEKIRTVHNKPITLVSAPNPGAGLDEIEYSSWKPFLGAVKNGDDHIIASLYSEACSNVALNYQLKIIPPLPEARANGVFNLQKYSKLPKDLSRFLDKDARLDCMVHASNSYGVHLIEHIFAGAAQ